MNLAFGPNEYQCLFVLLGIAFNWY